MKTKLLLFAIFLTFAACKKKSTTPATPANVCATCKEAISGYTAPDFCGATATVDTYITELYKQGGQAGQSWTCTKH